MSLFMWQDDIIGVARLIDGYLKGVFTSAGPPMGTRHLSRLEKMLGFFLPLS